MHDEENSRMYRIVCNSFTSKTVVVQILPEIGNATIRFGLIKHIKLLNFNHTCQVQVHQQMI